MEREDAVCVVWVDFHERVEERRHDEGLDARNPGVPRIDCDENDGEDEMRGLVMEIGGHDFVSGESEMKEISAMYCCNESPLPQHFRFRK